MIYSNKYYSISDAWFGLLYNIQEYGYKQIIQRGSFSGEENYRIQYPFVAIEIEHPSIDMIPIMPQGMESLAPTTMSYVEDYFAMYLMNDELKENEIYTYGSRIKPYINTLIEMLKATPYTNQAALEIASSGDIFKTDPPCLRTLTFKVVDNKLNMSIFFRSNDLYGGFPTNLAGLELLKQLVSSEANLENGKIYYASDGLHIYSNQLSIINTRLNRKC